jgi:protocatechuate 3,4-dioxygenase beta subunit
MLKSRVIGSFGAGALGLAVVGTMVWARGSAEPPTARRATLAEHRWSAPTAGSTAIACHPDEPGERVLFDIMVKSQSGRPVPGVVVIAYGADVAGLYGPKDALSREPRLRATVTTDARGKCQVWTVRPGPYPDWSEPSHVHFEAWGLLTSEGLRTIWFEGDPMITAEKRAWAARDTSKRCGPARTARSGAR